ncbi:MAG: hypothetical protein WCO55_05185 [Candidatus Falkowbacteria bacterium]
MFWRFLLNILLLVGLVIGQLSLVNRLPLGIGYVNLLLVILVYLMVLFGPQLALYWFIGAGWLLDVLSFNYWGLHMIAALLVYVLSFFLLTSVFTNRSLYALMMIVAAATIVFDVVTAPIVLHSWSSVLTSDIWLVEAKKIAANLVATIGLFYVFNILIKRVQPVFLRDLKRY